MHLHTHTHLVVHFNQLFERKHHSMCNVQPLRITFLLVLCTSFCPHWKCVIENEREIMSMYYVVIWPDFDPDAVSLFKTLFVECTPFWWCQTTVSYRIFYSTDKRHINLLQTNAKHSSLACSKKSIRKLWIFNERGISSIACLQ